MKSTIKQKRPESTSQASARLLLPSFRMLLNYSIFRRLAFLFPFGDVIFPPSKNLPAVFSSLVRLSFPGFCSLRNHSDHESSKLKQNVNILADHDTFTVAHKQLSPRGAFTNFPYDGTASSKTIHAKGEDFVPAHLLGGEDLAD